MIIAAKAAALLLLFLLCHYSIRSLLQAAVRRNRERIRLDHVQDRRLSKRLADWVARWNLLYRHLSDLLESTHSRMSIPNFLAVSLMLFLAGFIGGAWLFQSLKGVLSLSAILGIFPYFILRLRLINLQLKTRLDFLPAVEVFYQSCLLSAGGNIRNALRIALIEGRIMHPSKPVFEQLLRNLGTRRELDDCLRIFRYAFGHEWADYFANILQVGLEEGMDISGNLKDLISDMRAAQRFDQRERNRLLEIRIANFTPLLFLLVFVVVNLRLNHHSAYYYYFVDSAGRNMLLDALLLIFASFIMGIFLSMRRM